jgi:thiamine biosynthesis lipoprotein
MRAIMKIALPALAAVLSLCASCVHTDKRTLERHEFTQAQMGTEFRIVVYGDDFDRSTAAARRAFDRVTALNDIFSDYEYDSELSRLSRTAGSGNAIPLSRPLWNVLERANRLARETDGAFDVTVGPATSLWRKARREKKFPEERLLELVRGRIGHPHLQLNAGDRTATLTAPGMRLDLGAIAKGYALDAALESLAEDGFDRALVGAGGDVALGDPPPGEPGWTIELESPAGASTRIALSNCGFATSGDLYQFVELDGVRYSHIVDPRTGIGLTHSARVTVIAPDATTADSLSTALSVLEAEKGIAILEQHRGAEARIVWRADEGFRRVESDGFPATNQGAPESP